MAPTRYKKSRSCGIGLFRLSFGEKQNYDILEKQRNRRRQQTARKGIKVKVLTVQEIQEIDAEMAAKQAEEKAAKEAALVVTEANKFARAVWEALPIRDTLITAGTSTFGIASKGFSWTSTFRQASWCPFRRRNPERLQQSARPGKLDNRRQDDRISLEDELCVLCHLDLSLQNFLWLEGGTVCLLDWTTAGYYPQYFELTAQLKKGRPDTLFTVFLMQQAESFTESQIQWML